MATHDVVTLVVPDQGSTVRLRPQDVLQIIVPRNGKINWGFIPPTRDTALLANSINLKAIRREQLINDGVRRIRKGIFQVCCVTKKAEARQHHFWFRVNPRDGMKVETLRNGDNLLGILQFAIDHEVIARVKVILTVSDLDKDKFFALMQRSIWENNDVLKDEADYVGIGGRTVDEANGYVLNPAKNEQLIFETQQRQMLIEIAAPEGGKFVAARMDTDDISIKALDYRTINCRCIQRFMVRNNIHALPSGMEKMRLGTLLLRGFDRDGKYLPSSDRMIQFWVTEERDITSEYYEGGESWDETPTDEEMRKAVGYCEDYLFSRNRPKRSQVKIEEISGNLMENAKLLKVFIPREKEKPRCYVVSDPAHNTEIILRSGEELNIVLYRDKGQTPPVFMAKDWTCESKYETLQHTCTVVDYFRQKFCFLVKENRSKGEKLTFRCGKDKTRVIFVKLQD